MYINVHVVVLNNPGNSSRTICNDYALSGLWFHSCDKTLKYSKSSMYYIKILYNVCSLVMETLHSVVVPILTIPVEQIPLKVLS